MGGRAAGRGPTLLPQSLAIEEVGERIADSVFAVLDVRVATVFERALRLRGPSWRWRSRGARGRGLRAGLVPSRCRGDGRARGPGAPAGGDAEHLTHSRVTLTPEAAGGDRAGPVSRRARRPPARAGSRGRRPRVSGTWPAGSFTAEDVAIARAFADQAAIAVENHQLVRRVCSDALAAGPGLPGGARRDRAPAGGGYAGGRGHALT